MYLSYVNKKVIIYAFFTHKWSFNFFFFLKTMSTYFYFHSNHQFSSVTQSWPTLCDPMDCSTPGLPVHHQLPELAQTLVQWVGDAIQPSQPLSSPSPFALNLCHSLSLSWVGPSHQVAKVLELQLHHQSFQWIFRSFLGTEVIRTPSLTCFVL